MVGGRVDVVVVVGASVVVGTSVVVVVEDVELVVCGGSVVVVGGSVVVGDTETVVGEAPCPYPSSYCTFQVTPSRQTSGCQQQVPARRRYLPGSNCVDK